MTRVNAAACTVCELHAESTFKIEGMDCREQFPTRRHGDEPQDQQKRTRRQRDPGEAVEDRQGGGNLETVPGREHEWRQWTFHLGHPFFCEQKQRSRRMCRRWRAAAGDAIEQVGVGAVEWASNRFDCAALKPPTKRCAKVAKIKSISYAPTVPAAE